MHCGAAEKAGAQLDAVAFGTRDERADATNMWTRLETHFELVLDPRRESAVRRTAVVENRIVVVRSPPPGTNLLIHQSQRDFASRFIHNTRTPFQN